MSSPIHTYKKEREIWPRMRLVANPSYSLAPQQQSASSPASPWPPRRPPSLHTSACRTVSTAAPKELALAPLKQKSRCRHSHPTLSSKTIHPLMTESGIGLILIPPRGAALQLDSCHRRFSKKRTILNCRFLFSSSLSYESTIATWSLYAAF